MVMPDSSFYLTLKGGIFFNQIVVDMQQALKLVILKSMEKAQDLKFFYDQLESSPK